MDALSRAMLAGLSSEQIRKMLSDGITMEEIADAAESARDSGEGEYLGEGGFRPSDFSDAGNEKNFLRYTVGGFSIPILAAGFGGMAFDGWPMIIRYLPWLSKCLTKCWRKRKTHTGKHYTNKQKQGPWETKQNWREPHPW